jgi:exodeoxyribonuclease-3
MTKIKPKKYSYGINSNDHDLEGRVVTLEFDEFFLVAVYVPNSGEGLRRLEYRVNEWDREFFNYLIKLKKKKNLIVTGDFNVAHQEIDIYDHIGKEKQPGFTLLERNSFRELLDSGFVDTYRYFNPTKREYTFWANRANARVGNKGWRIDYFLTSEKNKFCESFSDSKILEDCKGSDHCPVKLILK